MIFFKNHSGWPLVPLKNVATLKRGYDLPVDARAEGSVPIYAANGKNGVHNKVKIKGPGVITGRSGTIGKVHYCEGDFWPLNTALYVTDFHGNHPRWIYYMLSSFKLERFSEGAGVPTLNRNLVHDELIPLPPLHEQKRIATILDKAAAISRKRQQAIHLADDFLRAVFLDMFGDSVSNPRGFRKGSITELAEVITGNAFKSDEYIGDSEAAVRLCRGTNVLTSYFDWSDTAYWPKNKISGLERYLLSSGDVILAMDRPWISSGLKVCIFVDGEKDTYLVQRVARLRPKAAMLSEYIYSCIKSKAFERHCCPTETTVPHISPIELRSYEVLIPDEVALFKYHQAVTKVKLAIDGMQEAALRAGDAFESMSQKAFAGQL